MTIQDFIDCNKHFCYIFLVYYKRYVEDKIKTALATSGVVVVKGPKFCGKTTTSRIFASSSYVLDTKAKINLTQANPAAILEGRKPRLIDEWQNVPDLWNVARGYIDNCEDKFGQLIFTGSTTPEDKESIYHSGAGRIVSIEMKTMSLYESEESKGTVSLSDLFSGICNVFETNEDYSIRDTAFFICRGGWPLSVLAGRERALKITANYISTLFQFENSENGKYRNLKKNTLVTMLKSYARNISTEARRQVLINDISAHEGRNIDPDTFDKYREALKDLFIISDIDAWNPNFRSKTTIVSSSTLHFIDTSVAANALHVSPADLMNDPETFGLFFEDFAVKELSIYADYLNGEIRHYRDANGLECDAVIHLEDGRYGLVEIKLGGEKLVKYGESRLLLLSEKIRKENKPEPAFMMVLTATGPAYKTEHGVYVIPVNLLKA